VALNLQEIIHFPVETGMLISLTGMLFVLREVVLQMIIDIMKNKPYTSSSPKYRINFRFQIFRSK
jgi:hypothetical protein